MSQVQNQSLSKSDGRNKIEGGNTSKKMNRDESPNPPSQFEAASGQGSEEDQTTDAKAISVTNLPPEMLMEILKCVDTRSLLACRLVNRQWNSISSRILCHRSDAQIWFELTFRNKWLKSQDHRVAVGREEKMLEDFLSCMKNPKSENWPFAHFVFSVPVSSDPYEFFDHPDFAQFISCFSASKSSSSQSQNQNQRIHGLNFKFSATRDMNLVKFLKAKLGNLIQNEAPFLENLSLDFEYLKSGSKSDQTPAEINAQQLQVPFPLDFQLPHLKVLRFKGSVLNDLELVQEFLSAAVNLKKLFLYEPDSAGLRIPAPYANLRKHFRRPTQALWRPTQEKSDLKQKKLPYHNLGIGKTIKYLRYRCKAK